MGYEFSKVSAVNLERSNIWHPDGLESWSYSDWACAMAGEAGEVCNAIKKLNRYRDGMRQKRLVSARDADIRHQLIADVAMELGDTFLYLDLLAQRLGLNIEECIVKTFNRVSVREGFIQRL